MLTSVCPSLPPTAAVTINFDGQQYVHISFPSHHITQAEDISLRFRTLAKEGLLFMTSSERSSRGHKGHRGQGDKHMVLYLQDGVLHLSVTTGSWSKVRVLCKKMDL